MKTVAISTIFHNNYNYGGMLQAYALYNVVMRFGFDVTEIDYDNSIQKNKWESIKRNLEAAVSNPTEYISVRKKIQETAARARSYSDWSERKFGTDIQAKAFQGFIEKEFVKTPTLSVHNIENYSKNFDYAIAGGDQVFNPMWINDAWDLKAIKADYKFSYSASIGKDNLTGKDNEVLKKDLSSFDSISVREIQAKKALDHIGIQSEITIDPVGLFTSAEWENVEDPVDELKDKRYVFAYILGDNPDEIQSVKRFATKRNLQVAMIPHIWRRYNEWDEEYSDLKIYGATPGQFVWLVHHAEYVLTDSFHGTMFSIIFNKKFYSFSRFEKNDKKALTSRLLSVLEIYGLNDRWKSISNLETIDDSDKIDFEEVNARLKTNREKGLRYLKKELGLT